MVLMGLALALSFDPPMMLAVRTLVPRAARQSFLIPTNTTFQRILVMRTRRYATNPSTKPALEFPDSQTKRVPHIAENQIKSPGLENAMAGPQKLEGNVTNPYKDGPSALDKAMTMFLFTELVRGDLVLFLYYTEKTVLNIVEKACGSS